MCFLRRVIKDSLVVLVVKSPLTNGGDWETWVPFLGQKDSLEEEMATHSNILAWRNPWREAPHRLLSIQSQRVEYDWSNLVCTQRTASPPWACRVNQHCFPCLITIILLCLKKKNANSVDYKVISLRGSINWTPHCTAIHMPMRKLKNLGKLNCVKTQKGGQDWREVSKGWSDCEQGFPRDFPETNEVWT